MALTSRRRFIFKACEYLSALPLVGVLVNNFAAKRTYYDIDISKSVNPSDSSPKASEFLAMTNSFSGSLEQLCRQYENAYKHTRHWTTTDSKGNKTHHSETYWAEPRNVPNHNVVFGWRKMVHEHNEKCEWLLKSLSERRLLDSTKLENLGVEKRSASSVGQAIMNVLVFGAETGALLYYDELLAYLQYGRLKNNSLDETVEAVNTESQISRRSLIKIVAALTGFGVAMTLYERNKEKCESARADVEKQAAYIKNFEMPSDERCFNDYFGYSPGRMGAGIRSYVQASRDSLNSGIASRGVREAFEQVVQSGDHCVKNLEAYFGGGIPEDLAELAYEAELTKRVEKIRSASKSSAEFALLAEAGALAGAMAFVIVPCEYINSKLS